MTLHTAFITGNSSGIGLGLTREYLSRGWMVYGLSRRGYPEQVPRLKDVSCDLARLESIGPSLEQLLRDTRHLDLVVLNAGILGDIKAMHDTTMGELRQIMDINVWSNKIILDWLLASDIVIEQIVFISSGAAVNGNKGWGGYALSKAALNMLAKLYVHEFPDTHIAAFAPGLVHTRMQDFIHDEVDAREFPSTRALKDAMDTAWMPEPGDAAPRLAAAFRKLRHHPSGSFLDIRSM